MSGHSEGPWRGGVDAARGWSLALAVAALLVAAVPAPVESQSTLQRTPNLNGTWGSDAGVVHFHFLHRFRVTPPPARKVLNSPTFLLATGLPGGFTTGGRYVTNSSLVAGEPNAWELFGRWSAEAGEWAAPVDLSVEVARNWTADSWDGELLLARGIGPVRLLAGARGFSSFAGLGDARWAVVGGGRLRLTPHVALAGDVARVLDAPGLDAAWSAGLQLAIPYTPHSLSLQVTNANTTTLQGGSVGAGDRRWGFEFTVPFTLSRYFGGREGGGEIATTTGSGAGPAASSSGTAAPAGGPPAAVVEMDNRLRFLPDTVRVRVGEMVEWRNGSDLIHTVTADPSRAVQAESVQLPAGARPFDSGDIRPGESFSHRFTEPGHYRYFCIPHEAAGMTGVVVVTGGG